MVATELRGRAPSLAVPADVLALVGADRTAGGRPIGIGLLHGAGHTDPGSHGQPSLIQAGIGKPVGLASMTARPGPCPDPCADPCADRHVGLAILVEWSLFDERAL